MGCSKKDDIIEDYLGNGRVWWRWDEEDLRPEVLQAADYYPFGLEQANPNNVQIGVANPYKFNGSVTGDVESMKAAGLGMEEVTDHGLNIYHAFYRTYDPEIGRMMQVDPMAEEPGLIAMTPYNALFNSPILYTDPNGDIGERIAARQWAKNNLNKKENNWSVSKKNSKAYLSWTSTARYNDLSDLHGDPIAEQLSVYTTTQSNTKVFEGAKEAFSGIDVNQLVDNMDAASTTLMMVDGPAPFGDIAALFGMGATRAGRFGVNAVSREAPKLLNQFNSVESLIQGAGKFSRVKGAQQAFIRGDGASIFKAISKGGTRQANETILMKDGTNLFNHFSAKKGVYTIDINRAGQVYKIRVTP